MECFFLLQFLKWPVGKIIAILVSSSYNKSRLRGPCLANITKTNKQKNNRWSHNYDI